MRIHNEVGRTVVQLSCDVNVSNCGRLSSAGCGGSMSSVMSTSSFDLKFDASPPHQSVTSTMGFLSDSASTPCKSEGRRSNKPVMEKRRRARINDCLSELKSLILNATKKDPSRHSKLEKADILELTVKHLQNVQRAQLALAVARDPRVLTQFKNGFSDCAQETTRYMTRIEGCDSGLRSRMSTHMSSCVSGLQSLTPLAFTAMAAPSLAAANVNIPAAQLLQQAAVNSGQQFVAPVMHDPALSPQVGSPAGLARTFPAAYSSTPVGDAAVTSKLPEARNENKEPVLMRMAVPASVTAPEAENSVLLRSSTLHLLPSSISGQIGDVVINLQHGKQLPPTLPTGRLLAAHVLPNPTSSIPISGSSIKPPGFAAASTITDARPKVDSEDDVSSDDGSDYEDSELDEPRLSYRHKKLRISDSLAGSAADLSSDGSTPSRSTHHFKAAPTNDMVSSKTSAFTAVTKRPLPSSLVLATSHADLPTSSVPEDLSTKNRHHPRLLSSDDRCSMKRKFSSEPSLLTTNDAGRGGKVSVLAGKKERRSDGDTPRYQRDSMWRPW